MDLALTLGRLKSRRLLVGGRRMVRNPRVRNHQGSISYVENARRMRAAIGRGNPAYRDLSPTGMQMIPSLRRYSATRNALGDTGGVLWHSASEEAVKSSSGWIKLCMGLSFDLDTPEAEVTARHFDRCNTISDAMPICIYSQVKSFIFNTNIGYKQDTM